MIKSDIISGDFHYRRPATTSRGTYLKKRVSFISLYDSESPQIKGLGECSLFPGLSFDDVAGFEEKLRTTVKSINSGEFDFEKPQFQWPSINFAIETAISDLKARGNKILYPSEFTEGNDSIGINGLIWMGKISDMKQQLKNKLEEGFSCIKIKIGAIDINDELSILKSLRQEYAVNDLEIRVDANGAFKYEEAPKILNRLSEYKIHSIEQPIASGHIDHLADLCESSPLPIALDEELIGKHSYIEKKLLLETIKPQYIVLKPGLLGGINSCEEWISLANDMGTGWWITSSLETNIGLNAIAQWTYTKNSNLAQGLSTGSLFTNNIDSPLSLSGDRLFYDVTNKKWDLSLFESIR